MGRTRTLAAGLARILLSVTFVGCAPVVLVQRPAQMVGTTAVSPSVAVPLDSLPVVRYRIGNPPEEAMYGREVLSTRYTGSGAWERFNVPAYFHWLQVYRTAHEPAGSILIMSPDTTGVTISTIFSPATGDIAGYPWLWVKAVAGTRWTIRLAR